MKPIIRKIAAVSAVSLTLLSSLSFRQDLPSAFSPVTAYALDSGFQSGVSKKIADGITLYFSCNAQTHTCEVTGSKITKSNATVNIPDSVTVNKIKYTVQSIGNHAFDRQTNLLKITNVPAAIGDAAFYGCANLRNVSGTKTARIGTSAFMYCAALQDFKFASQATYIGAHAFNGCESLTSVELNNIETIKEAAFYHCTKLYDLCIDGPIRKIDAWTFSDCYKLRNIHLADTVTEIGVHAFANCTNIYEIKMPRSISNIRTAAFINCDSLSIVDMSAASWEYWKKYQQVAIEKWGDGEAVPPTIMNIEDHAFFNCWHMHSFVYADSNSAEDNLDFPYPYELTPKLQITLGDYCLGWFLYDGIPAQSSSFSLIGGGDSNAMRDYAESNDFFWEFGSVCTSC